MPLPTPHDGEAQDAFISRCHEALAGEFPETDQRNAVCFKQWRESKGEKDKLEKLAADTFPPDKFKIMRDVPLFDEHVANAGGKEGRRKVYDRAVLEKIITRCNQRIEDTGNFPPSTIGHTPDADDPDRDRKMPDLIGFYGPMRLGKIGNVNPRWAIFADEYIYTDAVERANRHPRRSVELWGDGIIDPIARLGAETPRRDLGLTFFQRAQTGEEVCRYSRELDPEKYNAAGVAASPSSTNVSLKTFGEEKRNQLTKFSEKSGAEMARDAHQALCEKNSANPQYSTDHAPIHEVKPGHNPTDYAREQESPTATKGAPQQSKLAMLTPDDIRQIVDAIEQLDWVQYVKTQMMSHSAGQGAPGSPPAGQPGAPASAAGAPGSPPPGAAPPLGGAQAAPPPEGHGGMAAGHPPGAEGSAGPKAPKEIPDQESGPGGKGGPGEHNPQKKPPEKHGALEEGGAAAGGAIGTALGGPVGGAIGSGLGKAAGGAVEESDKDRNARHAEECKIPLGGMTAHARDPGGSGSSGNATPATGVGARGSSGNVTPTTADSGTEGDAGNNTPGRNARDADDVERMVRHNSEISLKCAKLERENHELREQFARHQNQLNELRDTAELKDRRAELTALNIEYQFDLEDEVQRCAPEKMSRPQYEDHKLIIVKNYNRSPVGDRFVRTDFGAITLQQQDAEKFSRETSEQARDIVLKARERGENLDFETELKKIRNGHAVAAK
jgi:hypothetical protein